jgi:adenylate kinase
VVIRTHPKIIGERLSERGYPKKKISENVEAELVDVCLVEAIDKHENVIEVDATNKSPEEVASEILELLNKGIKRKIGIVDWTEVYDEIIPYLDLGGEE